MEAMLEGRYVPSVHFRDRIKERNIDLPGIQCAIARCTVEPYSVGTPSNGGTTWRASGLDPDGERVLVIGLEAYEQDGEEWVILCTAFEREGT